MQPKSISFLIDTQLPPVLASFFLRKGFSAIHTTQIRDKGQFMTDNEIITYAIQKDFVVVTKDKDFVDNFFTNGFPPKVLQIQLGNIKNNDLVDILEANLQAIMNLFSNGDNLIIINQQNLISY